MKRPVQPLRMSFLLFSAAVGWFVGLLSLKGI